MNKIILLIIFVNTTLLIKSQIPIYWEGGFNSIAKNEKAFTPLNRVDFMDTLKHDMGAIYGRYYWRKGKKSNYQEHEIWLVNTNTNETFRFIIKRESQYKKGSCFFTCHLPPGNYVIVSIKSYVNNGVYESTSLNPVFSDLDIYQPGFKQKIKSGEIKPEDYHRFIFSVSENTINYVGDWNFKENIPSFSDNIKNVDPILKKFYRALNYNNTVTSIPTTVEK